MSEVGYCAIIILFDHPTAGTLKVIGRFGWLEDLPILGCPRLLSTCFYYDRILGQLTQ